MPMYQANSSQFGQTLQQIPTLFSMLLNTRQSSTYNIRSSPPFILPPTKHGVHRTVKHYVVPPLVDLVRPKDRGTTPEGPARTVCLVRGCARRREGVSKRREQNNQVWYSRWETDGESRVPFQVYMQLLSLSALLWLGAVRKWRGGGTMPRFEETGEMDREGTGPR